jgi:hypothetical protein
MHITVPVPDLVPVPIPDPVTVPEPVWIHIQPISNIKWIKKAKNQK